MILSLLFLFASSVQQHGSQAESNVSSKLPHTAMKQHNGVHNSKHEKVIVVSGDGTVHSPDFPHTYPRNRLLVWRLIAAGDNVRIQLTFDKRFGLEDPEDGICKYDFIEIEEPDEGAVLGRWCGSGSPPGTQVSKGNQIRIRFRSDQYFPSKPGFCIHYSLLPMSVPSTPAPSALPPALQTVEVLTDAVAGFSTVEEVMKYLEPDHWQQDVEELYKPTWQVLGKSYNHPRKSKGVVDLNLLREEVRLYSCTPRNFSVALREELKRTDAIFWPSCLLVQRCGGNCACCAHRCYDCHCAPTKVTKKYHEVLLLRHRAGGRGILKSLTDVPLEHHEECGCMCKNHSEG
ncbi:platelet-derived growth factor C-like [Conger conger]|uniref:platelet-derived growth factor C-like n=1 Tax=Conger conger TaxID=82655 RepID=UPI002A5A2FD8|nr:platelet-derived growth factor C-like [Conger conger]